MATLLHRRIVLEVVCAKRAVLEKVLLPQQFPGWKLLSCKAVPAGPDAVERLTIAPGRALYLRDELVLEEWERQGQVVRAAITPLESGGDDLWEPQVSASCRSSDGAIDIAWLNVTEWFENAGDEDILELQANEYGRIDSSVSVPLLEHFEHKDTAVADLFAYSDEDDEYAIDIICHVNQQEAEVWLAHYRPHLLLHVGGGRHDGADALGKRGHGPLDEQADSRQIHLKVVGEEPPPRVE
jgi:hypothetical protein